MPFDQADLIAELGSMIGTLDRRKPVDSDWDFYRRDVVHRWAHLMAVQPAGAIRRYSLTGRRRWTIPRGW